METPLPPKLSGYTGTHKGMRMERVNNVLLVEDSPGDSRLVREELWKAFGVELEVTVIETCRAALEALKSHDFQVVLLDLSLPDSRGPDTVAAVRRQAPDTPIVVLSGDDDQETALQALRVGAQDYLVKGKVDANLLMRALRYACERKRLETERERLIGQLRDALATVKQLTGLLPICASCKRIRTENGAWETVEEYIREHTDADFSHGICPQCLKKLYPDYKQ